MTQRTTSESSRCSDKVFQVIGELQVVHSTVASSIILPFKYISVIFLGKRVQSRLSTNFLLHFSCSFLPLETAPKARKAWWITFPLEHLKVNNLIHRDLKVLNFLHPTLVESKCSNLLKFLLLFFKHKRCQCTTLFWKTKLFSFHFRYPISEIRGRTNSNSCQINFFFLWQEKPAVAIL